MANLNAEDLLEKYIANKVTQEERLLVENWFLREESPGLPSAEQILNDHFTIKNEILKHIGGRSEKKVNLWPGIAAAAAIILVIGATLFFYNRDAKSIRHPYKGRDLAGAGNNIRPGKNIAVLTLAHGKTIQLSDAKTGIVIKNTNLTYNDGTAISELDQANGQVQTITTPRGGTYQITLSDGTKVWLNSASSLTYSGVLNEYGQRKVDLKGEAYFEVARDKKHPFLVKSAGQEVEVLGTHFNISSYADEQQTTTTLLEGKVHVIALQLRNGLKAQVNLAPGQQSILTSAGLNKQNINTEEAIAWKDGYFLFENENLESIMRKIARWYDVEVEYRGKMTDKLFGGMVSRSKNITQVLKIIQKTGNVKIKIEGRRVIIML